MPFKNGHTPWNKNKRLSEDHRRKLSEAHKGKPSSMKGLRHTDETRHKISIAKFGKKLSEEHCERISEGLKAIYKERTSKRRSAGLRRYYETHEVWNKGFRWSPEIKERIRKACLQSKKGMGPKKNDDR